MSFWQFCCQTLFLTQLLLWLIFLFDIHDEHIKIFVHNLCHLSNLRSYSYGEVKDKEEVKIDNKRLYCQSPESAGVLSKLHKIKLWN